MSRAHCRRSCLLVLATLFLLAFDARAGEPHVVILAESADKLLGTARRVLKDGGAPDVAAKIDQAIEELTLRKGLAGVDQKRPVGAYLTFDAVKDTELVIFVPTSSPKAFIELLSQLAPDVKQGAGEVLSFSGDGVEFFCKSSRGYCFLSRSRESLEAPSLPVTGAGSRRDFGIDVFLGKVPAAAKELAIQNVENILRGEWANLPPSLDSARMRGRAAGQRTAVESIRRGLSDADRISLSVTFGEATKQTQVDFEVVARPNTVLASTMEAYGRSVPSFTSLADTSVAYSIVGAVPFPREVREDLLATVGTPPAKGKTKTDPKALVLASQGQDPTLAGNDDVAKVIGGMEKLDFAFLLDSTGDGALRILAAVKVGSGAALLRLMESVPASKDGSAPWKEIKGAASVGKVFEAEVPFFFVDTLGTKAHFAVAGDAVFVALGGDTLSSVKSAIRRAGSAQPKAGPLSLHLRLSRLLGAFKRLSDARIERAREVIGTSGDQVDLEVYSTERTLRTRLTLGEAFPRIVAAIVQDAF